jgi:sugar (pentulose or hexulose) kinase
LLEGLAASFAAALSGLESILNRKFGRLVMVGGAVRNTFFGQLVANACRSEVLAGSFATAVYRPVAGV